MALPLWFLIVFLVVDGQVKEFPYKDQGVTLTFPTKALCDKALARVSKRAKKDGLIPNKDFAMVCFDRDSMSDEDLEYEYTHRNDHNS